MKKRILILFFVLLSICKIATAQCDMLNYSTAFAIPPTSFPYTNGLGITATATIVNANPLTNFTYNCGANPFTCSNPAWWINSSTGIITIDFSSPVCNLTFIVNGTNTTEEFYFVSNNGPVSITNYCSTNFTLLSPSALLCSGSPATGTIITVTNPVGATQYTLTHNGLGSGSRVSLLDCYVNTGCSITPPTNIITCSIPTLNFCAGATNTLNYTATGTYTSGNIFTAQLSNAAGSFATPTTIGSLVSTTSGSIPITIPIASLTGANYRMRVISSSPAVTGSDNGSNITIHALPTILANASPISVCQGNTLTLSGSGGNTYTWSNSVNNGVAFIPSSTTTYTVTGTDAFGCSKTNTITVPVNPIPTVTCSVLPNDTVCAGTLCTLTGAGATSYTWTNGVSNNISFIPTVTTTYTVTGSSAGCTSTSTMSIKVNPLPIINVTTIPNDTICAGESVSLTASGAQNYSWTNGVQNGINFTPANTTNYVVTAIDANNCSNTNATNITVKPMPNVYLGKDTVFCEGNSMWLNATNAGATYIWQSGENNPTLQVSQSGMYWVIVNLASCIKIDTIQVTVNKLPNVNLGPDTSYCQNAFVTLNATCPNCSYTWQDNSSNATYNATAEGTYYVTANDKGCLKSDTIFVDEIPLPVFNLGPDTAICLSDKIELNQYYSPTATYLWSDNSTKPTFTIADIGNYWLEITEGRCTGRDERKINFSDKCNCPLFVPNAFTPNGDLKNDEFRLLNTFKTELIQFSIYNRWGEEVFKTTNPGTAWEGRYKGIDAEVGTYFYFIKYKCLYNGKESILHGDITLLR